VEDNVFPRYKNFDGHCAVAGDRNVVNATEINHTESSVADCTGFCVIKTCCVIRNINVHNFFCPNVFHVYRAEGIRAEEEPVKIITVIDNT
jgi:hypothetical protein